MCITTITYDCHHRTEENIPCRSYTKKLQNQPRPSFWQELFCIRPRSFRCTQKPGKRRVFSKCPKCVDRENQERARKERETEIRVMMARDQHNKREKQRLQERRRSARKSAWRCSKCIAERRRPDQLSRAANGGLCCARGLDEFEQMEKASGYQVPAPSKNTSANRPRLAPVPTREQRHPELRFMTSMEKMREDARVAANSYGWDRHRKMSDELESSLVAGYLNSSGSDPMALGFVPPPHPPPPQPKYEDPGIDHNLWRQMQDVKLGAHGRIPPPPERPHPVRPLTTRKSQDPWKPVVSQAVCPKFSPSSSRRPPSPVSPLSPQPEPRSYTVKSSASFTRDELFDLLNDSIVDWQPLPQPRYRY